MADVGSIIQQLTWHQWSGSRSNGWYLNFLAVHPDFRNRRHGSNLVEWGVERAKEEEVTASVINGVGRDPFYRRCGFTVEVGKATDGEGKPLQGKVDGGTILFRDVQTAQSSLKCRSDDARGESKDLFSLAFQTSHQTGVMCHPCALTLRYARVCNRHASFAGFPNECVVHLSMRGRRDCCRKGSTEYTIG